MSTSTGVMTHSSTPNPTRRTPKPSTAHSGSSSHIRRIYHAPVSMMTKIFSEAFTKPSYAMEDFLDHTYNTLFETEINCKIKKEPALTMIDDVERMDVFPSGGEL
ncbi:hypothetical protein BJ165DRAFT_1572556 [Panaeolus papilionaceus]|nr:hypothetical protein BJ165DRAFT_1572556 [Panaeolus papilionaceus]